MNHALDEKDRKSLVSSQLIKLALDHGVHLTELEQDRLDSRQLLALAEVGQILTSKSRGRLDSTQRLMLQQIAEQQQKQEFLSKPIFISHAHLDMGLADKLVDLLITGAGINRNDVFCTSLEGMGIPAGTNFVEFIRQQIQNPKMVLMLITPNYLKSSFCLCEMGATWALSVRGIPLVMPPLDHSCLNGVVTAIQAVSLADASKLSELKDSIARELGLSEVNSAIWERKRDDFIDFLEKPTEKFKAEASAIEEVVAPSVVGQLAVVIQKLSTETQNEISDVAALQRLFRLAVSRLKEIYADAHREGLPQGQLAEAIRVCEQVGGKLQTEESTVYYAKHAVQLLNEHHAFLMWDM